MTPIWFSLEHAGQRHRHVLTLKDLLTGEHLQEHDAERPDVGTLIHGPSACLLRTHIRRRPHDHAHLGGGGGQCGRLRRVSLWRRIKRLRQPKVQHLHGAVIFDLDVGRFQITVDHACFVRGFESFGDLPGDGQRLVERDRALGDAIR